MKTMNHGKAAILTLAAVLSAPLQADTFTVNATTDPETGDPTNCTTSATSCSLRDALAAAEVSPDFDTIVFSVADTIYLKKQLVANYPVGIEGGMGVSLRIDQGYEVVTQPDRFDDDKNGVLDPIEVVHPTYYIEVPPNDAPRTKMLMLHGSGSFVNNMSFDASITPQAADAGVARVDWNSDGTTDNRLYPAVASDGSTLWLVAAGISVIFDPAVAFGKVDLIGNTIQYVADEALHIENSAEAVVTENFFSAGVFEGIRFYNGGLLTVNKNTVTGFRTGLKMQQVSGLIVEDNDLIDNRSGGLLLEGASSYVGENVVKKNRITGNSAVGVTIAAVDTATLVGNEVRSNGILGIDIKGAQSISVMDNKVVENGVHPILHGGIRVAENSGLNAVTGNTVTANSGFGIVIDDAIGNIIDKNIVTEQMGGGIILLNAAQGNTVENNKLQKNDVGILSTSFYGVYPSANTLQFNGLKDNLSVDIADEDPNQEQSCNNTWAENKFKTSYAASGDCIE